MKQLPLAIKLNDSATLSGFNWDNNAHLKQQIDKTLAGRGERFLFLWGGLGCGKSHLLQACCQAAQASQTASYLPLKLLKEWGVECVEGVYEQDLICIDDIDCIAGLKDWEEALFHLYNKVKANSRSLLIIAANQSPSNLGMQLPDLQSRLSETLIFQLHELGDQQKLQALTAAAMQRGFDLPDNVSQFLLSRCSRNMHDLDKLLNALDEASLAAQRKITIPFVKTLLNI